MSKDRYSFREVEGNYAYVGKFHEGLAFVQNSYEERRLDILIKQEN